MSLGSPSQLGTLLIQRLDTLLGISQSQQVNLSSGARPDAVLPTERNFPGSALKNPGTRPLPDAKDSATRTERPGTRVTQADARAPSPGSPSLEQPTSSIQTQLGRTAQYILQLIQEQPQPPTTQGRQPLIPPTTPSTLPTAELVQQVHQSLQQEVRLSGLFYESQLHRHLQGRLPDADTLRQQPQMQQPEQLSTIVRQQLELLATGQWEWRGELWPGASLYWQLHPVDDEADESTAQHSPKERKWTTHLALTLPRLGTLNLDVFWSQEKLRLKVQGTEHTIALLRPFTPLVQKRLAPLAEQVHIQFQMLPNAESANDS